MKFHGLIPVLALAIQGAWAQEIHSWKDADGKVHYSEIPPAGVQTRKLGDIPKPPLEGSAARKQIADKELDFRKRKLEAQDAAAKAEKDKADTAERQKACDQARSYLRSLNSGERVSQTDSKGERFYLDDPQREEEARATRKSLDSHCQ